MATAFDSLLAAQRVPLTRTTGPIPLQIRAVPLSHVAMLAQKIGSPDQSARMTVISAGADQFH